jgi:putative oxidoreductase
MSSLTAGPVVTVLNKSIHGLGALTPLLDLGLRLWVARVFWNSGMTKIQSWDTTLMLFEYEYAVPVIPFELAAYLATAGELVAPVLLVFGLGARFGALALFVLNYVAMISYPDINPAGVKDHLLWGTMLAVTFFHGPGKLSIDHLIKRRLAA